jgi:site-specific DNA-methyltransferase (adenine-specific)
MSASIGSLHEIGEVGFVDNQPGAIEKLQDLNEFYRHNPWPPEYSVTTHKLRCWDARNLSGLKDESIHLIVTSPPYWTLKEYPTNACQLGAIDSYDTFLDELDKAWAECMRVLVPGGRICCVVGDVCIPRKRAGRHHVIPLHADITVRVRKMGLDSLTPILWFKIANGALEAEGNGAGFYGKPYQPGAIVKNDFEYILFFRKGGAYRSPSTVQKALSMLTKDEMKGWLKTAWTDVKGESTRRGHPAPYPVELAERLIRLFSFAGDTVLDPFAGTGTTVLAAMNVGRNSVGVDCDPTFVRMAAERLQRDAVFRQGPRLFETTLDIESPR